MVGVGVAGKDVRVTVGALSTFWWRREAGAMRRLAPCSRAWSLCVGDGYVAGAVSLVRRVAE